METANGVNVWQTIYLGGSKYACLYHNYHSQYCWK